jgi:hypothetical protein
MSDPSRVIPHKSPQQIAADITNKPGFGWYRCVGGPLEGEHHPSADGYTLWMMSGKATDNLWAVSVPPAGKKDAIDPAQHPELLGYYELTDAAPDRERVLQWIPAVRGVH